MLQLFKTNSPAALIVLLFYFLLLHFPFLVDFPVPEAAPEAPFAKLLFLLFAQEWWQPISTVVLVGIIIFANGVFINLLCNGYKLIEDDTFLPALSYLLLSSFLVIFSPSILEFIASFFIIFSAYKIFALYKSEATAGAIFDAAFLTAVAGLFYLPALFVGLWVFIGVAVLRSFSLRDWIIVLSGLIVPFFLCFTYYFWIEDLHYFFSVHLKTDLLLLNINRFSTFSLETAAIAIFGVVTAFFLLRTAGATTTGNIQLRKYLNLIILLSVIAAVIYFTAGDAVSAGLAIAAVPVAVVFAFNFFSLPGKVAEIVHLVLFALLLTVHYYNFAINHLS